METATIHGMVLTRTFDAPHVVTFTALDDRRTEVTVRESGYPSAELATLSRGGMEQCLDKMAAIFTDQ